MYRTVARLLTAALAMVSLHASAAWPDKVVKIIVPFPAGAAADNATRVLAKKLSEYWGQTVIVENRGGVPGVMAAVTSPPDGYTFLLGAGSLIVTRPLMAKKLQYNPQRDLLPVAQILTNTPVIVVNPSIGVKTIPELVAYSKKRPGELNYSSSGIGSPNHLIMEMFNTVTDTRMVHIAYNGAAPSVTELIGGQIQVAVNAVPSVLQHIRSGSLVALAVAANARHPSLPNVPTMAEIGIPNFDFRIWYALFAPAKVPPAIVGKVSADVVRAMKDPEVAKRISVQGGDPAPLSNVEFDRVLSKDIAIWSKLISDKKLTLDE
jgi:tripartite-type tricarboxylate transporter receptor subunit TctC